MIETVVGWMQTVRPVLAILVLAVLAGTLVRRFRDDADPSFRMQSESGTGYASVLISGVHLTMVLVGAIAMLTWPLVVESQLAALSLGLIVVGHYLIEKSEVLG